jgi:hypothetical protein
MAIFSIPQIDRFMRQKRLPSLGVPASLSSDLYCGRTGSGKSRKDLSLFGSAKHPHCQLPRYGSGASRHSRARRDGAGCTIHANKQCAAVGCRSPHVCICGLCCWRCVPHACIGDVAFFAHTCPIRVGHLFSIQSASVALVLVVRARAFGFGTLVCRLGPDR